MKLFKIGNEFVNAGNVIEARKVSRLIDPTDHRLGQEEGIAIRFVGGEQRSYFGPGLWTAFEAWLAEVAEVTDLGACTLKA